ASAEVKLVHYPRPSSWGDIAETLSGLASVAQAVEMANTPARPISLDAQFRYFSRNIQPLCWMPVPDLAAVFSAVDERAAALDMLGLPAAGDVNPFAPVP